MSVRPPPSKPFPHLCVLITFVIQPSSCGLSYPDAKLNPALQTHDPLRVIIS